MNQSPRRLLFLLRDSRYFLSHRLPLALAAQASGLEVAVACALQSESDLEVLTKHQIKFHQVPFIDGIAGPGSKVVSALLCAKVFKSYRPRVVHAITIRAVLLGALLSIWQKPEKFIALFAGLGTLFRSEKLAFRVGVRWVGLVLKGLLNRRYVKVVFMNEDDRNSFLSFVHLPIERTDVIKGSGVDLNRFSFMPYALEKGARTVLMASRLLRDKGVLEFIEAAKAIKEVYPEHRFLLVGDTDPGNPTSLTRAEIEALCGDGQVEWLGHRSNIPELLSQADIYCLPSYHEGLSLGLLEAASCGKAIVTTDIPGCRAVVEDEHNGLLVPPRDVSSLANALAKLISSPTLAAKFGREARKKVEGSFSLEGVNKRYLELYGS